MALLGAQPTTRGRALGLVVQPCPEAADHDWHPVGMTLCPGLPTWAKSHVSLVAGVGFAPR